MGRFRNNFGPYARALRHGTTFLALAMIGVIWLGAGLHVITSRSQLFDTVRKNSSNLAHAFEQDVVHSLREVDWTIQLLRRYYVQQGPKFDFGTLTSDLNNADGLTLQYAIIGPTGILIHSSISPNAAPVDLSSRAHFRVHLESKDDFLFVSKPVLGKISGKWTIQLTRRIVLPNGDFGGVIVASVDPNHFSRLYDAIDVGRNGAITLVGLDGVIRARKGLAKEGAGQSIADSAFFKVVRSSPEGVYTETSPVDGIRRIGFYRRMPDLPLVVSVGFAESEIFARYHAELLISIAGASALSLLLLGVVAVGTRNRVALKAAADALKSSEQMAIARDAELKASEQRETRLRHQAEVQTRLQAFTDQLLEFDQVVRADHRSAFQGVGNAERRCRSGERKQQQCGPRV